MDFKEIKSLEQFQFFLNEAPKLTKKNELARGALYVPIAEVEKNLDELFAGLWSIENFKYQVIANEIVGSLELRVFHPVAETWITRTGAGAVQIMVSRDKPAVLENKIKNALETGFPKLKAECLKNAARSFGNIFGRNLNRKTGISDKNTLSQRQEMFILTPHHKALPKVIEAITNGYTIEQISDKYQITPEAMKILKKAKKIENETV